MTDNEAKNLVRDISYLTSVYNKTIIQSVIKSLHPVDLSLVLKHLPNEHVSTIFSILDTETAADVLTKVEDHISEKIVEEIKLDRLLAITTEMASDDMADFLSCLPKEKSDMILDSLDHADLAEIRELLEHDEKSAGGIMGKEFIAVYQENTVSEAINKIREEQLEDIHYVFVTNRTGVLVGLIALNKLILAPLYKRIKNIMDRDVISVKTSLDQEEVASIARKYDLVSIPVIDDKDKLVGRITIDDIVDVIDEEASEDIHKMAGISEDVGNQTLGQSSFSMSRLRLPWLFTGLLGGIVAALVISYFEGSVKNIILLSFFTPVVMSMGGNIGIQSSTIMVRGFATGEITMLDMYKFLFKEVKIGFLNGVACSILFALVIFVWQDIKLGLLLGITLFTIMLVASLIGSLVPIILKKFNIDPALATGPFIMISNDIVGLIIYFSAAMLFYQ